MRKGEGIIGEDIREHEREQKKENIRRGKNKKREVWKQD